MSEEWGPWIEHDQRGCPAKCENRFCEVVFWGVTRNLGKPFSAAAMITPKRAAALDWWMTHPADMRATMVLRYRIRKPRGMAVLEGLLSELPQRVDS